MIEAWINLLTKPEETIAAEKQNASLGRGIINFVIAGLIFGVIAGLIVGIFSFFLTSVLEGIPGTGEFLGLIWAGALIGLPILGVILAIIGSLVLNMLLWIGAKIAGGTGSFTVQYYLLSLIAVPLTVVYIVSYVILFALMFIPLGSIIGPLIFVMIIAYTSIIMTMAYISVLKETHGFTTASVAITTAIAYALIFIVAITVVIIIGIILLVLVGSLALQNLMLAVLPQA